ncbi:MAG: sulfatase [Burkholderiales bacterium]
MTIAKKRPNFIVIMTDQQRADYLGCAGHPFLKTPAIDSLAARGTRFTRFYVSSPVCMPNRATYMTGRLPTVHGARGNGMPLSLQANTFVDLLRANGYETVLVGKSHLMTMTDFAPRWKPKIGEGLQAPTGEYVEAMKPWAPDAKYDQENPVNWARDMNWKLELPFYGFEKVHLCTGHGDEVGGEYLHWLKRNGHDPAKLTGPKNAQSSDVTVPQAWRTAVPEELYPTSYIREHSLKVLDDHAKARKDDPFFLMMSFPDPHHPFTPPGKYWNMYSPDQVKLPPNFYSRPDDTGGPVDQAIHFHESKDYDVQKVMTFMRVNERQAKEAIALSCGMITMIDDAIAAVLAKLKTLGLDEDTVILFTADHGDFLGDKSILLKGPLHLNSIINVPFIWSDPAKQGAKTCDALSGTIDISSTILARAGLNGFHGMQGRSLLPEIETGRNHGNDVHLIDEESQFPLFGCESPVKVRSMVTPEWRVTLYEKAGLSEMYNLKNDPDENHNLWNHPDFLAKRAELLEQMVRASIGAIDMSPAPRRRA